MPRAFSPVPFLIVAVVVSEMAKICGGGGGGRPNLAQAGAKDVARFQEAMIFAQDELQRRLNDQAT